MIESRRRWKCCFTPGLTRFKCEPLIVTVNTLLAIFGLGGTELIVVLAIVLLLFGASRIPQLAKGLGQGIGEFRKAARETGDGKKNSKSNS